MLLWGTVLPLPFPALLKMTLDLGKKWKEKAERGDAWPGMVAQCEQAPFPAHSADLQLRG